MKKIISVICAAVMLFSAVSVSAFALTAEDAAADITTKQATFEDVFNRKIQASDARDALLTSAGLKTENENNKLFDIDEDGKVTAIDARIFLRIAAQLDSLNNYFTDVKLDYFNAIINSIKPNSYNYYRSRISTTEKMNINDSKGIFADMERQLDNVAELGELLGEDMGVDFDIEAELRAAEGAKEVTNNINRVTASSYPVIGSEFASLLTMDDITKIEYKTNQSYTFTMYNEKMTSINYADTITGLDSLTIYLKSDSAVALSGNYEESFSSLIASKAMDILTKNEIDNISESLKFEQDAGMEELGEFSVGIIPKQIQYSNCYVTVYFYPETGIPVVTEHNLNYGINLTMDMFIDLDPETLLENGGINSGLLEGAIKLLLNKNNGKILYVDSEVGIYNKMNEMTAVYLYKNNPNYLSYGDYKN